jgi:hypothetical protein
VPATDYAALLEKINALSPDAVALVAGHTSTVPVILRGLGSTLDVSIEESDYGNLFILVPRPPGPPAVVRLRY